MKKLKKVDKEKNKNKSICRKKGRKKVGREKEQTNKEKEPANDKKEIR